MTNVRSTNKGTKMEAFNVSYSGLVIEQPIPPSTIQGLYVYPPVGRIEKLSQIGIYIVGVAGATAGVHSMLLGDGTFLDYFSGQQVFNGLLYYNYGSWSIAIALEKPYDNASQLLALQAIRFSNDFPLRIDYNNSTDSIQVTSPTIDIRTEVVSEW